MRGGADNTVTTLESRSYASYGEPFGLTGANQTPYGFTGEPLDDNGLLYLRARYYNPTLGVFTALDPFEGTAGRPMSLNGYSWVEGDVPNMTDPSGQDVFPECIDLLTQHYHIEDQEAKRRCDTNTSLNYTPSYRVLRYPFLSESPDGSLSRIPIANSNRQSAINYAIEWSQTPITNPAYPDVGATNCANFASQVLLVGGFQQDSTWYLGQGYPLNTPPSSPNQIAGCGGIFAGPATCPSPSWAATRDLRSYLINSKGFHRSSIEHVTPNSLEPLTYTPNHDHIKGGDIVFFYQGCDILGLNCPNHAGVIVAWGPPIIGSTSDESTLSFSSEYVPWFADNTGSRHMRPINAISLPSSPIEIIHISY